jgi:anti-sigma-K factor RskA
MVAEEHVFDSLAAYALDCLEAQEAQQVAEHLAACELCRAELQAYQAVVDELPSGMQLHDPPPALKTRLMQQVRASQASEPAPAPSWLSRLFGGRAPLWGLASLALVLLLGASNLFLWQRLNRLESASRDSLRTIQLSGSEFTPNATGLLVMSVDGKHGTLVVDRLPVLDEAHQYQLWLTQDGVRDDGGVFSVDRYGYAAYWVHTDKPLASYTSFGITIEPAGGSLGPTGDKVLGGDL